MASLQGKPPPAGGRLGSPAGSAASLALSASGRSGSSSTASVPASSLLLSGGTYAYPRTPENALAGEARPRSARGAHSGSATPTPSEDALSVSMSLASGATSFSSAADAHLFAPASTEDAVHAVPSLLSLLLSGRTDEQVGAARRPPALLGARPSTGPVVGCLLPWCDTGAAPPSRSSSALAVSWPLPAGAGRAQAARVLPPQRAAGGGGHCCGGRRAHAAHHA